MEILDTNKSTDGMQLNTQSMEFILETAKWAKFLSIVGFVGIGLLVIAGLFMGTMAASLPFSPFGGAGAGVIIIAYLLMAVLYFFPVFYLFKAAVGLKNGINSGSDERLTEGFENFKSHYKFMGIFMIIILSLYALIFLLTLVGAMM